MSYSKPIYYDTLSPDIQVPHIPIQYTVCREFSHICRYKGLRQLVHCATDNKERFIALETPNDVADSNVEIEYYTVPLVEENRLDIIANKFLGSAQYSWVLSYINGIEDGYTVREGQRIRIIKNFTDLFNKGEILASISALMLNLGSE